MACKSGINSGAKWSSVAEVAGVRPPISPDGHENLAIDLQVRCKTGLVTRKTVAYIFDGTNVANPQLAYLPAPLQTLSNSCLQSG